MFNKSKNKWKDSSIIRLKINRYNCLPAIVMVETFMIKAIEIIHVSPFVQIELTLKGYSNNLLISKLIYFV